ncbi:hypothetical protein HZA38_06335 [Candidatus Peregrinibacteria bacterium]|nr:hypothetical protein [Candidatus Peregrinibacteria bacterium]
MKIFRTLVLVVFIGISFLGIWEGQMSLFPFHENRFFSDKAPITAFNSGKELKYFALGFDNFLADLFWLRTLQYVGGNARLREFPALEGFSQTITDLDPKFAYVYHFAGLMLPSVQKYPEAEEILLKGEKNVPNDWQISFDLGFLSFYYLEDYDKAIAAYERCLTKSGCLRGAKTLIPTLEARKGKVEIAFWNIIEQYQNAELDEEKNYLLDKIEEVGKLFLLQKITVYIPLESKVSELIGKKIPKDEEITKLIDILENQVIHKDLVSDRGIILEELTKNVFVTNPFLWDAEKKEVRPEKW